MKLSTANVDKLRAQAAQAREKSAAAFEEAADLARRAERLAILEDPAAGEAKKSAARFVELAQRFEGEAGKLEKEASIAAATLARDEAREELRELEAALAPVREAIEAGARAYGELEAATKRFEETVPAGELALNAMPFPQFDTSRRAGVEAFQSQVRGQRSALDGCLPYESGRIGFEHLASAVAVLLEPRKATLAQAERQLIEAKG